MQLCPPPPPLYKKPLLLFVLPFSVPGCIFIYDCHNADSCKHASEWLCEVKSACMRLRAFVHERHCVCRCTAWASVPTKIFAFDAPSCGLQAASLTDNPLSPAMLLLLKMKGVDECWHAVQRLLTLTLVYVHNLTHSALSFSCNCLLPSGCCFRGARKRKTMKLSRDLSNLVVFYSVASQECLNEGETPNLWYTGKQSLVGKHLLVPNLCFSAGTPGDILSFSETRAQSLVHHKTEQFLAFNQRQLSRIYPSAYRIDSSNFNPQFYWNVGCQLGKTVALRFRPGY